MGIVDWFRGERQPQGMSRRDFFARMAGRIPVQQQPDTKPAPKTLSRIVHRFYISGFQFHDGPVLMPSLRPGFEFTLALDPTHASNPDAVRIERGKDHFGYVPLEISKEIKSRLEQGEAMVCRVYRIDPNADLSRIVTVELLPGPEEPADSALQNTSPG